MLESKGWIDGDDGEEAEEQLFINFLVSHAGIDGGEATQEQLLINNTTDEEFSVRKKSHQELEIKRCAKKKKNP